MFIADGNITTDRRRAIASQVPTDLYKIFKKNMYLQIFMRFMPRVDQATKPRREHSTLTLRYHRTSP